MDCSIHIDPAKEILYSKIVIFFSPISLNMAFGCSKEPSHRDESFLSFFLYILPDPLSSIIGRCTLYTPGCRMKSLQVTISKLL